MSSVKTNIDMGDLDKLPNIIRAYEQASGRTLGFAMTKVGRDLSFALYAETAKEAPQKSTLAGLAEAKGFAIKRKKGKTIAQEIKRRIAARKFSASGWLPSKKAFSTPGVVQSTSGKLGSLEASMTNNEVLFVLTNKVPNIATLTTSRGIMARAVYRIMDNIAPYILRKLDEDAARAFLKL